VPAPIRVNEQAETVFAEGRDWRRGLLLDVGSTFTKALVIGPSGAVLGRAEANTTIDNDVMIGVAAALATMPTGAQGPYDWALASSSAAGGLRMASIGLTAALSGRAGALAALGAGAKVVASEHGWLDDAALERIEATRPHLVLLAGGLDGGNSEALLHNARMLARLVSPHGFVIAGNRDAAQDASTTLGDRQRDVRVVDMSFRAPAKSRSPRPGRRFETCFFATSPGRKVWMVWPPRSRPTSSRRRSRSAGRSAICRMPVGRWCSSISAARPPTCTRSAAFETTGARPSCRRRT
jgi:hypothetical protein